MDRRSDYLYHLPERLIAQEPLDQRDFSRLLVLRKETGEVEHRYFRDLPEYLEQGDALVLNNTRVIPARLLGNRPTGGEIELLLLEQQDELTWECLAKPAKRLKIGETVQFPGNQLAEVLEIGEEGRRIVRFSDEVDFGKWLEDTGSTPLPPYIRRSPDQGDRNRYQTIYARHNGAVAAPTAGLHFTPELLDNLSRKGIGRVEITLHVGIGTFRPVTVENLVEHKMDSERYIVEKDQTDILNGVRSDGKRVVAVGTTVVRTLESVAESSGRIIPGEGKADLFIRPPYKYKAIDALVTNFHLPGSTLMMLVSAFAGYENIRNAYDIAVREDYRFFSYGDAMLII